MLTWLPLRLSMLHLLCQLLSEAGIPDKLVHGNAILGGVRVACSNYCHTIADATYIALLWLWLNQSLLHSLRYIMTSKNSLQSTFFTRCRMECKKHMKRINYFDELKNGKIFCMNCTIYIFFLYELFFPCRHPF